MNVIAVHSVRPGFSSVIPPAASAGVRDAKEGMAAPSRKG
jgi:hypothetical protein